MSFGCFFKFQFLKLIKLVKDKIIWMHYKITATGLLEAKFVRCTRHETLITCMCVAMFYIDVWLFG